VAARGTPGARRRWLVLLAIKVVSSITTGFGVGTTQEIAILGASRTKAQRVRGRTRWALADSSTFSVAIAFQESSLLFSADKSGNCGWQFKASSTVPYSRPSLTRAPLAGN
jgi:hypothetical protein